MSRRVDIPVPGEELLRQVAAAPKPLGLRAGRARYALLRETYFDTRDGALRTRGLRLCLRIEANGAQSVEVAATRAVTLQGVVDLEVVTTPVVEGGLYATLAGASDVAQRVRDVVDPAALRPQFALDVDRESRELKAGWFGRPVLVAHFDRILAHRGPRTRALQSMVLFRLAPGGPTLERITQRLQDDHGLAPDGLDTLERAVEAFHEAPPSKVEVSSDVRMVLLVRRKGALALNLGSEGALVLPMAPGSGEELAQTFACRILGNPEPSPEPELVGFAPSRGGGSDQEVWLADCPPDCQVAGAHWVPLTEVLERVGAPRLRDPSLVAALLLLVRSEVGQRILREAQPRRGPPQELPSPPRPPAPRGTVVGDFLDAELSILDFNQRVLEMAEDPTLPVLERLRFLSIFASNLDEFFVVRVGRLKAAEGRDAGSAGDAAGVLDLAPAKVLDLIAVRVRALVSRHYACFQRDLMPALAEAGVRLVRWEEVPVEARAALTRRFEAEVFPLLTPRAMASSPGHPFPRMESLGLSLAAVLRGEDEGIVHLAHVPVPATLPRFFPVSGDGDLMPVEELIAAHAATLFPAFQVVEVHAFRVSRSGDVDIDEDTSASLLSTVEDEVEARPYKPVVRLEVQRSMPREVLAYLLRELRQEAGSESASLGRGDVFEVDGPLDLRTVAQLAELPLPDGAFPAFAPREVIPADRSVFQVLGDRDLLVYHPYESFDGSVGRFVREAAADPHVVAIKLTLYRTGKNSPFADTLLEALRNGKEVSVFVEVKARFDEESNIQWTRRLIEAGGHVVYGVVGYKTHAKTAVVVRREGGVIRRYVHIGTGNYNAATSRFYTDVGLLSADPDLGADLNDFFNELTGSAGPPVKQYRRLLVAPNSLAQGVERLIAREVEHARAGRRARIQAKLNGLTDRRTVKALYDAAGEGVEIDLVVRAVCTLRPGLPGLSEGIRVRSILGRFLEHARIYYFENAGAGDYYIASADWRRRNLRKRVEVASPVDDPDARARLRAILDAEMSDPRAWELRHDGSYARRNGTGTTTQDKALAGEI